MSLPEGYESKTKKEWTELADDTDPAARKQVTGCLRAMGHDPSDYMSWPTEERVEVIMGAQGEEGDEEPKKGKNKGKKTNGKTSAKSASSNGDASGAVKALIAEMAGLREEVTGIGNMLADTHFLLRILVQSNKQLKQNSEDEDIQEALYGELVVGGEENEGNGDD